MGSDTSSFRLAGLSRVLCGSSAGGGGGGAGGGGGGGGRSRFLDASVGTVLRLGFESTLGGG